MAMPTSILVLSICLGIMGQTRAETPIRKVITLLEEMKSTVEKDASEDLKAYDKYMCWCETNKKEKTAAIEAAEQRIADLTTFLEEAAAEEAELKTEISGLESDIAADEDALKEATAVREKEMTAFQDSEADMKETLQLLGEAITTLSKVQLLQKHGKPVMQQSKQAEAVLLQVRNKVRHFPKYQDVLRKDLYDVLGSFHDIAEVAVERRQHANLGGAFLAETFLPRKDIAALEQQGRKQLPWEKSEEQLGQEANPNALEGNAAGAKSYNSRSGSILGILKEMADEFARDLAEAQKAELAAEEAFQNLKAAKLAEIKAATEQKEAKEGQLAKLLSDVAEAKEDLEATTAALTADQEFLATLEKNCADEETGYQERVKVRSEEIRALGETLKILTDDDARALYAKTQDQMPTLLQLTSDQTTVARERAVKRSMQRIARVARKHGNLVLASLAVRMELDGFAKVKEMMDKMLAELAKQQKDEYAKWEECKKGIDETEDSIKEGEYKKKDLDEKHKEIVSSIETLEQQIEDLKNDVSEMQVSLKKAGEDRKAENQVFQTSISDQRATVLILEKAMARLKEFYDLVQIQAHRQIPAPPPKPSSTGYSKNAGAGGVMTLIQMIIEDAKRTEAELSSTEQKAQEDYGSFVSGATASIEADRKSIEQKTAEVAEAKGEKSETEASQLANDEELATLTDLLKTHHLECDYVIKYFDIRQQARQEEMDSIKDAKAILSGADFGR
jgi:chromosome segregation ATPase